MENAVDALKIAFAMFVFVIAITIAFSVIAQAKSTSDYVLFHSDKTNFYEPLNSGESNREVSVDEVISNLHKYYKETVGITVLLATNKEYIFDLNSNKESIFLEGKTKLNTEQERKENLEEFIKKLKDEVPIDAKFTEEFVEVPISRYISKRRRWN